MILRGILWSNLEVVSALSSFMERNRQLVEIPASWIVSSVHDSTLIMAARTYLSRRVQAHFIYECTDESIAITVTTTVTQMFVHQRQLSADHKTTRLFSILK